MLGLWINNYLTIEAKRRLRALQTSNTFNNQYGGDVRFFVIVKMVIPDTRAGCSDTKKKIETTKMSQLEHDISQASLQIIEWMNEISIAGEYYSEFSRQKFNLYSTSYCTLFKDYTELRRSEME